MARFLLFSWSGRPFEHRPSLRTSGCIPRSTILPPPDGLARAGLLFAVIPWAIAVREQRRCCPRGLQREWSSGAAEAEHAAVQGRVGFQVGYLGRVVVA
jgi:hypothetical protein